MAWAADRLADLGWPAPTAALRAVVACADLVREIEPSERRYHAVDVDSRLRAPVAG